MLSRSYSRASPGRISWKFGGMYFFRYFVRETGLKTLYGVYVLSVHCRMATTIYIAKVVINGDIPSRQQ